MRLRFDRLWGRGWALALSAVVLTQAFACDALTPPAAPVVAPEPAAPPKPLPDFTFEAEEEERAAAQQVLVQFQGAVRAPATLTRTREEARLLAEEIAGLAAAPGADFGALARDRSDEPNARDTLGHVGSFKRGDMVPPFEEAAFALKVGEVSGAVESVFGFHVIKRVPLEEVRASHILVQYVGAQNAGPTVTRTREDALKLAEELRRQALEPGTDFAELARTQSGCPSASAGGDLGRFGRGVMVPAFEQAAFSTPVESVSQVVETPFGFHIIRRAS